MSIGTGSNDDEQLMAVMAIFWLLGSMAMLGPVGLAAAAIAFIAAMLFGLELIGGMLIAASGVGLGLLLWRSHGWLTEPLQEMAEIYRTYLFDRFRWDTEGLFALFGHMIWHRPAWTFFGPLGIAAGDVYWTAWTLFTKSPLKQVARGKPAKKRKISMKARINRYRANLTPAAIEDGSLIGVDQKSGAPAHLTDRRQASRAGAGHHRQRQDGDALEHRRKRNQRRRQANRPSTTPLSAAVALCPMTAFSSGSATARRNILSDLPYGGGLLSIAPSRKRLRISINSHQDHISHKSDTSKSSRNGEKAREASILAAD